MDANAERIRNNVLYKFNVEQDLPREKPIYEDELVRKIKMFTLVNYILWIDFPSTHT